MERAATADNSNNNNIVLPRNTALDILTALETAHAALNDTPNLVLLLELETAIDTLANRIF